MPDRRFMTPTPALPVPLMLLPVSSLVHVMSVHNLLSSPPGWAAFEMAPSLRNRCAAVRGEQIRGRWPTCSLVSVR